MSKKTRKQQPKQKEEAKQQRKPPKASRNQTPKVRKPSPPAQPTEPLLMFSKLEFSDSEEKNKIYKRKSLFSKNPKQALEALQRQKEKLAEMKSRDPQLAATKESNDSWARAILKSKGVAVHDDARMLKKAVHRKEKDKKKGEKRWKEIKRQANKEKTKRQTKRRDNVQNKNEEVKKNRMKKQR